MSGGNGGGKGFFDNAVNVDSFNGGGNFFENLGNDIVNYGIQSLTTGYAGYENGSISNGVTTNVNKSAGKAVVSGVKEVTGAKAAEDANNMARQQFEEQKANADAARAESIKQTGRDQLQQSRLAGAARASQKASTNKGQAVGSLSLGDDERDFLGL